MSPGVGRGRGRLLAALVVATGLLVGAGGGWALAQATRPTPVPTSTRPLAASNPDVPTTLVADSDLPPLGTDLAYVPDQVPSAGTVWRLVRPAGWVRKDVSRGIRWVLPDDTDGTYSVRVEPTGGSSSTAEQARSRLAGIRQSAVDGTLSDVELVGLTDDTVTLTYVQDGRLKYQHTQFVPATPSSSTSVFEVSTSGRLEDRAGLDALAEHMAESVRRT